MSEETKPTKDPLGEARYLLAGLEADVRRERDKLHQLRRGGADHFTQKLAKIHERGLDEDNVDTWCRETDAIASAAKK